MLDPIMIPIPPANNEAEPMDANTEGYRRHNPIVCKRPPAVAPIGVSAEYPDNIT